MGGFTFRQLDAWQQSMKLAEDCYRVTALFPKSEMYGLTSQIRRAAVSIGSNLAEGHSRRSTNAYMNHVSIALGSHGELSTLIALSTRLGLLQEQECQELTRINELVGRLLYGLHRSLAARGNDRT